MWHTYSVGNPSVFSDQWAATEEAAGLRPEFHFWPEFGKIIDYYLFNLMSKQHTNTWQRH